MKTVLTIILWIIAIALILALALFIGGAIAAVINIIKKNNGK